MMLTVQARGEYLVSKVRAHLHMSTVAMYNKGVYTVTLCVLPRSYLLTKLR